MKSLLQLGIALTNTNHGSHLLLHDLFQVFEISHTVVTTRDPNDRLDDVLEGEPSGVDIFGTRVVVIHHAVNSGNILLTMVDSIQVTEAQLDALLLICKTFDDMPSTIVVGHFNLVLVNSS